MSKTIVFAITNDMLFAVANVIIGLERHCRITFNYLILVQDKNRLDRRELTALYSLISEKEYSQQRSKIIVRDVELMELHKSVDLSHKSIRAFVDKWTYMPLVKAFMFKLFDDEFSRKLGLERAPDDLLWLDCDILVLESIEKIFSYGEICGTLGSYAKPLLKSSDKFDYIGGSDIKPNGGVILLKKAPFHLENIFDIEKEVRSLLRDLADTNVLGIEEHLITALCKKKQWHLDILSDEYNYLPGYSYSMNPRIVHSLGKNKFWNNILVNRLYPEWERNNQKWLSSLLRAGVGVDELGKYNHSTNRSNSTRQLLFSQDWQKIWDSVLNNIRFSHSECYQQAVFVGNWCKFYLKRKDITSDCHYEIIKQSKDYLVALHFENGYNNNNDKLIKFLSTQEKAGYQFNKNDKTLSLQIKTSEKELNNELTKLIDLTLNNIIKLLC